MLAGRAACRHEVWTSTPPAQAFVFATAYVACSVLWSGFYIRVADMKVSVMRGLSWLSYTKYAMMGVSRVELQDQVYNTTACTHTSTTGSAQARPCCRSNTQP